MSPSRQTGLLARMFRPRSKPAAAAHILALDLWPEAAYAVGDVHGCFDLYRALEAQIVADIARLGGIGLLVVLGDTIDRGPKSAEMIDHLIAPPPPGLMRVVLRGNHEEMFLRFLQAPERAASWLRHGGLETLASYGIDTAPFERGTLTPRRMQNVLETMVPPEHRQFLAALPDAFILPPFMFTHAGVDPARSPEQQSARDLRWGANVSASALDDGAFPLKVVHGHTPCAGGTALIEPGRINLDTGAYVSGKLTAARFLRDGSVGLFEQTRV